MAKHEAIYETALEHVDLSALSGNAVNVKEIRDCGFVTLRVRRETAGVAEAMDKLGITLPSTLGFTENNDAVRVKWISPDEYLISLPLTAKDEFISKAKAALDGIFSAVVDNSGGYALLHISGSQYQEMLSKLSFYDLHGNLPTGKVVSTMLSKSPVIFYRVDQESLFCMLRWSFADYALKIILAASEEFNTKER